MRRGNKKASAFPKAGGGFAPFTLMLSALMLSALLLVWVLPGQTAQARESLGLDEINITLKPNEAINGWDSKKFSPIFGSGQTFFFQFVAKGPDSPDAPYLHMKSGKNNSFSVGSTRKIKITEWPVLAWDWKITKTPEGGDVREKKKDDQAGAMCVVIGAHFAGFDSSLCYIFENDGPKETVITSSKNKKAKYLILRTAKADKLGEWYSEKRNVLEDYKKAFGKEPAKEGVIGFQIDSNDTKSSGEAFYRNLFLHKQ